MRRAVPLAAVAACLLLALALHGASAPKEDGAGSGQKRPDTDDGYLDPLGPNAACYVCHMTFVDEQIAKIHAKADVTCTECHGVSEKHANDENIGATPPDIIIKRPEINRSCRPCHKTHDVRPEELIARWIERNKSKPGRPATPPKRPLVVCTDCHGNHKIDTALQ